MVLRSKAFNELRNHQEIGQLGSKKGAMENNAGQGYLVEWLVHKKKMT